jgi:hypothetical protein
LLRSRAADDTRFLAPVFAGRLDANVEVITAGCRVVQL